MKNNYFFLFCYYKICITLQTMDPDRRNDARICMMNRTRDHKQRLQNEKHRKYRQPQAHKNRVSHQQLYSNKDNPP